MGSKVARRDGESCEAGKSNKEGPGRRRKFIHFGEPKCPLFKYVIATNKSVGLSEFFFVENFPIMDAKYTGEQTMSLHTQVKFATKNTGLQLWWW